jgi:uncharacterized protein YybS (DUF2232 family)
MQAGSVKMSPAFPVLALGKGIVVTVLMAMCVAFIPLVGLILVPFLVLPLAYVVAGWGARHGAVVAVVSTALIYVGLGASAAIVAFLLLLGVGMVLGLAVRKGWTFERGFALTVCGGLMALALWAVVLWQASGVDLTWIRETFLGPTGSVAWYTQFGVSTETAGTLATQMRQVADVVPYLLPGVAGTAAILGAACSLGLAYKIFPRLRERIPVAMSLSGFRLHWATAYASILGLAALFLGRGDGNWRTVMVFVGINVLMVSQTLFFVQGLAVVHWFVVSRQIGKGSRIALYFAAVLGQLLLQLTGLVGLFDTWLDYRKRYALKSPGAGSAR